MIISEIGISEFRGIKQLSKSIQLTKFNLIIGRNNSGKSSILEALYLAPHPSITVKIPLVISRHEIVARLHSGFASLVYGYSGKARIACRYKEKQVEIVLSSNGGCEVSINGKNTPTPADVADLLNMTEDKLRTETTYIPSSTDFVEELQKRLINKELWSSVVKQGAHVDIVKELINPVVSDTYTEVFIERNELKLRKERKEGPLYIHIADMGDGVERALTIALALEYLKPGLVLWDDLESSAHPGLVEAVLRWLAGKDWQVVVTTHSLDVLNEYAKLSPPNSQVIALKKNKNDVVCYKTYTPQRIEEILESGVDIRKIIDILRL